MLLLARDPDDPEGEAGTRRVLAHVKSNVAPLAPSLNYEIKSVVLPARDDFPEVETARIDGNGASSYSGRDLLGSSDGEGEDSAVDHACDFLRAELSEIPRRAKDVKKEARDAGISDRTLDRAKARVGVKAERVGGAGKEGFWAWSLRTPTSLALLEGGLENPHETWEK